MCLHLKVEVDKFEKTYPSNTYIGWKVVTVNPDGSVCSWLNPHKWVLGLNSPRGTTELRIYGFLADGCFHVFASKEDAEASLNRWGGLEQRLMKVKFEFHNLIATGTDDDGTFTGAVLSCWVDELPTC